MDSERPVASRIAGQMTTESGIRFTFTATRRTFKSGFDGFGRRSSGFGPRPQLHPVNGDGR